MVLVHHARHTVEPEAIKVILVHPKAKVGQEETLDFRMTIVEETRVPKIVPAAATFVEVQVVGPVEHVQSAGSARARRHSLTRPGRSCTHGSALRPREQ